METRWSSDPLDDSDSSRLSNRDTILLKCREAIEALTSDLEAERNARMAAESEIRHLHQDLAALEDTLESLRERERSAAETVRMLTEEKAQGAQRIQRLELENASLKGEKGESETRSQGLQRKLQGLTEALERSNRELGTKQQLMAEWNQTLPSLETKLENLTRENKRLAADRDQLAEACEKEREQTRRLQRSLDEKKTEVETLQKKLKATSDECSQRISSLERAKASQQQELAENYNRKANAYYEQLQRGLREQKDLIEKTTEEVTRLQSENADLSSRLDAALEAAAEKERELEAVLDEKNELQSMVSDLEQLENTHKQEVDLKDQMHASLLLKLDEETQHSSKLEAQLEALADDLENREELYQSQIADLRATTDRMEEDLKRTQDSLRKSQQSAEDSLQRLKHEHHEELQRIRDEAEQSRQVSLSTLESRMEEMETQRESDHDYFQIEMLKAKEEYTQTLIAKEEELKKTRAERDRLRCELDTLPSRLPKSPRMAMPPVPSLRISSTAASKPLRQFSSHSMRQSFDSPQDLSRYEEPKPFISPRSSRSEQATRNHGDSLKLLSQLKEITSRLEKATPVNRYA